MSDIRALLTSPALRGGVDVEARIVVRRFRLTPREIDAACSRERVSMDYRSVCELVVNGSVVAAGELVEQDGGLVFQIEGGDR